MTVDGRIVNSCLTLIPEVDGATVVSVEGLAADGKLHAVQQAFIDYAGLQCGFCIPGMLVSAKALIDANPHANEEQVRTGLAGNLCRCTGYDKIVKAVLSVTNGDPVPVGVANASTKASTVEGGSPVIMFQE
jgi:carbon-monoxide dehydrogenase small subunit